MISHLPAPRTSPTRCIHCMASTNHGGFIDFAMPNVPVHGYDDNGSPVIVKDGEANFGRLYLCASCVLTAASLCGCAQPEEAEELRQTIAQLEERAADAEAKLSEATALENRLMSAADVQKLIRRADGGSNQPAGKPKK